MLCVIAGLGTLLSTLACSRVDTEFEPIELKLAHFMSSNHVQHTDVLEPFAREVAEATNGRVEITIYPGGSLGKPPEQYDAAVTRITDIAFGLHGYTTGKFPLVSVMELPFMAESASEGSAVLCSLYEKFPEIQDEHPGVKVLWLWTTDAGQLVTSKPVQKLEDLKDMKLRCPSAAQTAMIEAWGATPVMMPVSELYDALQKGVVDGTLMPLSGIYSFNLHKICNYVTIGDFYVSTLFVVMNLNSWNKISAEDQQIIEMLIGRHMSEKAAAAYDAGAQLGLNACVDAGVEIYTLPSNELARWKEAVSHLNEEWANEMEDKGLPGEGVYNEAVYLAGESD